VFDIPKSEVSSDELPTPLLYDATRDESRSLDEELAAKNDSSYSIHDPVASDGIRVPGSAIRSTMYSLKFISKHIL
jgi:hypothetical protein